MPKPSLTAGTEMTLPVTVTGKKVLGLVQLELPDGSHILVNPLNLAERADGTEDLRAQIATLETVVERLSTENDRLRATHFRTTQGTDTFPTPVPETDTPQEKSL